MSASYSLSRIVDASPRRFVRSSIGCAPAHAVPVGHPLTSGGSRGTWPTYSRERRPRAASVAGSSWRRIPVVRRKPRT